METAELQLVPEQAGAAPMKQLAPFSTLEETARKMAADAEAIALLSPTAANARVARTMRLEIRPLRTSIEKRHAELKRPILDESARLDAGKNALLDILKPLEAKLLALEQFAEIEQARIWEEKRTARVAELSPYLFGPIAIDLGTMSDDAYAALLADSKAAHAAKLEREAKEKEEAAKRRAEEALRHSRALEVAPYRQYLTGVVSDYGAMPDEQFSGLMTWLRAEKQRADDEQERQRLENERLRKEAEEKEAEIKAERERVRNEQEAAAKKAREELEAQQAKARAERLALEETVRKEREIAAAEKASVRKEMDAIEARESAENARLAGIAEAQRQETARLFHELERKKKAEADAEKARKEDAREAAAAPDKAKLEVFAQTLTLLPVPALTTPAGKQFALEITGKKESLSRWIHECAQKL